MKNVARTTTVVRKVPVGAKDTKILLYNPGNPETMESRNSPEIPQISEIRKSVKTLRQRLRRNRRIEIHPEYLGIRIPCKNVCPDSESGMPILNFSFYVLLAGGFGIHCKNTIS
jgi:hypothetical protein